MLLATPSQQHREDPRAGSLIPGKKTAIISTGGGRETCKKEDPRGGAPLSLQFWTQAPFPHSQGLCSVGLSPLPWPAGPAHTSVGQEPALGRGQAEVSKVCLPGEAHISEKGQKPRLQTLLRQYSGVSPAGQSHAVATWPGPVRLYLLPVLAITGSSQGPPKHSQPQSSPRLALLSPEKEGTQNHATWYFTGSFQKLWEAGHEKSQFTDNKTEVYRQVKKHAQGYTGRK